jgi:hypothetical protein
VYPGQNAQPYYHRQRASGERKAGWLHDIDGCLSNTTAQALRKLHNGGKLLGYDERDVKSWWWDECRPITKEEVIAVYDDLAVLGEADHHADGYHHFQQTAKLGFRNDCVTGRRDNMEVKALTLRWLIRHGMEPDRLFFVPAKQKALWAMENSIVAATEDHGETAEALAAVGVLTILIATPYNAHVRSQANLIRVDRNDLAWATNEIHQRLIGYGKIAHDQGAGACC